jgi:hypothetical protein
MRYPGYGWRYRDKGRKKGNNDLVNHYHKTWVPPWSGYSSITNVEIMRTSPGSIVNLQV